MPRTLSYLSAAAIVAVCGSTFAAVSQEPTRAQQRATALLDGKTAGPAQRCIRTRDLHGSLVPDEGTILYRAGTRLVYRTDIDPPCPWLSDDRAIVTRTNLSQLCEGDQFQVVDTFTGVDYGVCNFGSFVPYRAAGD